MESSSHPTVTIPSQRVLTCVYCGQEYPQDTPAHGHQVLTDHIATCEKHPMRQLTLDKAKLRSALVGLVGVDTAAELDAMDGMIRAISMPEQDRINTLNAIHALRDTLP